jgi:hypothetical protein
MLSKPEFIVVLPVYVFNPDNITIPEDIFVKVPVPASIALTNPLSMLYDVAVSKPVVPDIVPLIKVTKPTASEKFAISNVPPDTVTAPFESALLIPYLSMPALIVVIPVYKFSPESTNTPSPYFVSAPEALALAPEIVSVLLTTSIMDVVAAVKVKFLFVEAVTPVYCSVPPLSTKLPAALLAAPRLPAIPPFPIVATLNIPVFIVVTPVYVLTPESNIVPVPVFVIPNAPDMIPLMVKSAAAVPSLGTENALVPVKARRDVMDAPLLPFPIVFTVTSPPSDKVPEPIIEDPVNAAHSSTRLVGALPAPKLNVDKLNLLPALTVRTPLIFTTEASETIPDGLLITRLKKVEFVPVDALEIFWPLVPLKVNVAFFVMLSPVLLLLKFPEILIILFAILENPGLLPASTIILLNCVFWLVKVPRIPENCTVPAVELNI